ncbi:tryptophan synthase alpha chain [Propionibacteriaceae bacterium ES.041]|uniref:Tryptophan synthase alpha chain n=1 Tax=Enemella evansiae TaxID=2016499 RepID=A0A255GEL0_9ACTN|nr:tryptophan synthase subunit alpha [Enemella evansiae]OYO07373.1 tryptophan synthase subunit alpha [Enemella evansiae]OYO14280.1 tryptophan synthase subunit alpha [Enemella evansiae]PFG67420.1 tryptophan synthase alpha chain [Propionibacteriaceae bacterium ES.041]
MSETSTTDTARTFALGRTGRVFRQAEADGRKALVGFLHVGYPEVATSLAALRELAQACDLVEIGLPYSDPVMDGPVIQRAGTSALTRGVRTRDVFAAAEAVAEAGGNAVVMTYWNLVEHYGVDAFARDLAAAGGSGLITPDLTPDEAEEWFAASDAHDLDRIFLVAPSSSDERIASTVDACRGWLYATSVMGVTGVRSESSTAAPELVRRIRALRPEVPIGIGLGVSNGAQARETAEYADAVIVGSALVRTLIDAEDAGTPDDLSGLREVLADLRAGVRG